MNVVIINHSDSRGGASVASIRLLNALVRMGVDARMLVVHSDSSSPRIEKLKPAWKVQAEFLAEHAEIYIRQGFSKENLFQISTGRFGMPVHKHPWVINADIVLLAWINQGMVSLDEIARIKAPVVWVMHDMWCLTGICHLAGACKGYINQCGNCPLLKHPSANDLSHNVLIHKKKIYAAKPIRFVAVSNWLAGKAAESSLLSHQEVSVIPNVFPIDEYGILASKSRKECGLPLKGRLVVMAAARLDAPIKGLPRAIEALNMLTDTDAHAVFVGALKDANAFDALKLPYTWLGPATEKQMNDIFAHADIVLSSSDEENLPTTLIEGIASGCLAVTTGNGGQLDIVDHLLTGYISNSIDAAGLAEGLRWALNQNVDRNKQHKAMQRFAADHVAQQYISLFSTLIDK